MPSGDYTVNPPIGFWPEYLRAVVDKIGKFYGIDIRIKWNLFSKSSDIMDSVKSGESDMTDMYMILSSFYSGKDRIEAFSVTCSPGGYESTISTLRSFNVNSITELNNFLVTSDNTKIGALSAADFNTVKPFLNAKAEPVTFESVDEMRQKMLNNEIVAGITSSNPGETDAIVTFRR